MSPWFTRKSGTLGSQGLTGSTTQRGGRRRPTSRRSERPDPEIGEDRFGRNRVSPVGPERWLRRAVAFFQFMLLAVLLVCAGYQSHYIFFKALYFRIQEISVEGTQALESQEVVSLSGISLGDLFFKYNYERVKDRVRRHPRVKDVRVVVKSPNSIKLQIEEKQPRFYLQHGEEQLEIDENGVVLGPREHTEPLPLVRGAEVAETRPGEDADGLIPAELEAELRLPDPDEPLTSQAPSDETTGEAEPPLPTPPTPQLRVRHRKVLAEWVPALAKSPLKEYEAIEVTNPHEIVVEWKGMQFLVSRVDRFMQMSSLIQPLLLEAQNRGLDVTRLDLRFPNPIMKIKPKAPAPEGGVAIKSQDVTEVTSGTATAAAVDTEETATTDATPEVATVGDPALPGEPLPAAPATPVEEQEEMVTVSQPDDATSIEDMDEAAFAALEVPAGEEPPPEAFIEETALSPASEVGPGVFENGLEEDGEQDLESFFGGQTRRDEPAGPPAGWNRAPAGFPVDSRPARPEPRGWPPPQRPQEPPMDLPGLYPAGGDR